MSHHRAIVVGLALIVLGGCTAILGGRDLSLTNETPGPGAEGGVIVGPDGATFEGGAVACGANLASDPAHCGACNHDCLGGACNAGRCEPVVLASGLRGTSGIAVDATRVFVTTRDGVVMHVGKDGKNPVTLASGQVKAQGVVVDGADVYWSDADFKYDPANPAKYKGGVWGCTIASCTPRLVDVGDFAQNLAIKSGWIYFAAENAGEVRRVLRDGGAPQLVATINRPYSVAVDDAHVYYQSDAVKLLRAPVAGGAGEEVGPLTGALVGFVATDATRVYWTNSPLDGAGHVYAAVKANPNGIVDEFGSDTKRPNGVAVDDTYVYWSEDGTLTNNVPNNDGVVRACPKTGCPASGPILLATGLVLAGPIALDERAVYFTEFGSLSEPIGRVRKVAKP